MTRNLRCYTGVITISDFNNHKSHKINIKFFLQMTPNNFPHQKKKKKKSLSIISCLTSQTSSPGEVYLRDEICVPTYFICIFSKERFVQCFNVIHMWEMGN